MILYLFGDCFFHYKIRVIAGMNQNEQHSVISASMLIPQAQVRNWIEDIVLSGIVDEIVCNAITDFVLKNYTELHSLGPRISFVL